MFKKGDILQHKVNKRAFRKILKIKYQRESYGMVRVYKVLSLNKKENKWVPKNSKGLSLTVSYVNYSYNLYKRMPTKVRRLQ